MTFSKKVYTKKRKQLNIFKHENIIIKILIFILIPINLSSLNDWVLLEKVKHVNKYWYKYTIYIKKYIKITKLNYLIDFCWYDNKGNWLYTGGPTIFTKYNSEFKEKLRPIKFRKDVPENDRHRLKEFINKFGEFTKGCNATRISKGEYLFLIFNPEHYKKYNLKASLEKGDILYGKDELWILKKNGRYKKITLDFNEIGYSYKDFYLLSNNIKMPFKISYPLYSEKINSSIIHFITGNEKERIEFVVIYNHKRKKFLYIFKSILEPPEWVEIIDCVQLNEDGRFLFFTVVCDSWNGKRTYKINLLSLKKYMQ